MRAARAFSSITPGVAGGAPIRFAAIERAYAPIASEHGQERATNRYLRPIAFLQRVADQGRTGIGDQLFQTQLLWSRFCGVRNTKRIIVYLNEGRGVAHKHETV
jgi:hypothetical protein